MTIKIRALVAVDRMGSGYITRGILVDMPRVKGAVWSQRF
jgi:hypothetical protein